MKIDAWAEDSMPSSEDFKDIQEAEQISLEEWRLLFPLDSILFDDFGLMFGDCGRMYFYIRKEDFTSRRFDRVWLIL